MPDDIPLSAPDITEAEIRAVVDVLRSGRLSIGPVQQAFEDEVANRTSRTHAIACSSGTAGLHMIVQALGIGPGDEVITTPFSFIASSNAILYAGAKPVFVDIDSRSLNMDPASVEAAITPKTKAILAVEAFGNPTHMDAYRAIADRNEVRLIEDACEGLGGKYKKRPIGSFGHAAVFGFYPNKQITTGEGGMVVTDDDRIADACRSMRNQGRAVDNSAQDGAPNNTGSWLAHERLGYNYRLSEIQAALGLAQMHRLDEIVTKRDAVARRYIEHFMGNPEIILPTVCADTIMSWFVFVIRLSDQYTHEERDRIIDGMRRHEVGAAAYFPCIHLQPFYREQFGYKPGDFPVAESVSARTIALPFFNTLSDKDADFAAQTMELMLSRENIRRT